MSNELERSAHPDPEAVHAPPERTRLSRGRRRWISLIGLVFPLLLLMPYLGALSPVLSPLVYANLAPPQWHNATPHGYIVLTSFAASTDEPGLAFACGSLFTLAWPQPWSIGSTRYWRSTDGGAHWQLFQPPFQESALPFQSSQYCDLAMPPGGNGIVLATVSSGGNANGPETVWMSHDAGNTWHQVDLPGSAENVVYRNGVLYNTTDFGNSGAFGESMDDGATWSVQVPSPDGLVRQGWRVDSMVPDYRAQGRWYRELSRAGSIPVLEQSEDNGSTWSVVGPIGTSAVGALTLATTPVVPGRLCAGQVSGETRNVILLASGDGGRTWRAGIMPTTLNRAQGETTFNLAMGATGECYEGFHYGLGRDPEEGNSYFGFLYLASDSAVLGDIPLTNDGNDLALSFTLVPAGNGMPARLVTELDGNYPGWAPVFADLAAETTDGGQFVWHAVP
jgi:hypothetical protein